MKKKVIIGSIITIIILMFIVLNVVKNNSSVSAFSSGKAISANVVTIQKGNISASISANGVTEEIEKTEIIFDSPMKVTKVLVETNQKVVKGQKLLELDMSSLNSEYDQLMTSKVIQELSMQKLKKSKGVTSITENNIKSAESTYNDSKKSYEDNLSLFNAEAISQSELDRTKKAFEDAKITLDNARMSMDIDTQTQAQNLKATLLKIKDIEEKIQKINDSLLSPSNGIASEVNIQQGAYTSIQQPAIKIVDTGRLRVKAKVSEFNIKNVVVGQFVKITGDSINKDQKVTGKVTSISPTAVLNATSNGQETVIEVLVTLDKSEANLRSGLNLTCEIETDQKKDVIVTGMEIFEEDKDSNKFVYVVDTKNNIMHRKPVSIGVTSDMSAEITSGLNAGDVVVLYPQPTFKDGAKINILKDNKK